MEEIAVLECCGCGSSDESCMGAHFSDIKESPVPELRLLRRIGHIGHLSIPSHVVDKDNSGDDPDDGPGIGQEDLWIRSRGS